ncbi:MAG: SCP2 sterol-binding domain-containing protein, partial [Oscillospiraceae bacterium]|nr:SCP2 sterol-binding domain-containing protein [Oscillospiraceae bacterium]
AAKKAASAKAAPGKAAAKPAAKKAAPKKAAKKELTAADVCAKLAKKLDAKKAAAIDGKVAVDIKLYGTFEAHMYIEVKDNKLTVAPYDYIEKDIEAAISVENALLIADGKLTIADALADGRLYAFGNISAAAKLAKLF